MSDPKHPHEDETKLPAEDEAEAEAEAEARVDAGDEVPPEPSEAQADQTDQLEQTDHEEQTEQVKQSEQVDQQAEQQTEQAEQTEPASQPPAPVPPPAKTKGRALAVLALLLAIAGAAGVGYLYYLLVYLQPIEQVNRENTAISERFGELERSLSREIETVEEATTKAIEELAVTQAERLANTEAAVTKSLNDALQASPPSQREWKLAEAEYLLRIANHRVLMEQDSVGALSLLQAADQIMAELDDFALHQVRARLADEIIALRQVPRDDLQGIYLRLESIKAQVENLPLPEPSFLSAREAPTEEQSVWQTLYGELKEFIRVRSIDGSEALKPLLAPEEIRYLELNLRLALEQAQLASLKRQQDVFEQSLLNVRRWLVTHVDPNDARTKALLESVDELLVLELARPMPEISGSLNELLSIRRSGS